MGKRESAIKEEEGKAGVHFIYEPLLSLPSPFLSFPFVFFSFFSFSLLGGWKVGVKETKRDCQFHPLFLIITRH